MRTQFFTYGILSLVITAILAYLVGHFFWIPLVILFLLIVGVFNSLQTQHSILTNFPVVGYFRYFFESISPEIQQYFIERSTDGKPFSRNERSVVYQRAKNLSSNTPFGTQLDLYKDSYEGIKHSIFCVEPNPELPRVVIGDRHSSQVYNASIYNISAMSFGSLSENAIMSLNEGARKGGFFHNTGEGGLSDYHLVKGGDICWQIGTGYFGCRDVVGQFSPEKFQEKMKHPQIKLIELKISQGAKPGHGGVLPAEKNTAEIAKIRGVKQGVMVLSPPYHTAFHNSEEMILFIQKLRELSGGKPIGFKLCIGKTNEFVDLVLEMKKQNTYPDFITIDGAEGGTGAAPLEFSDHVGMPLIPALIFVNKTLIEQGVRHEIKLIASGKLITASAIIKALALGADLCNSARGFMFSLGCIQALRCHTNDCPTGVATQNKMLMKGLNVNNKADRVQHFHHNTLHAVNELLAATGKININDLSPEDFMCGDEFINQSNAYFPDILN